MTTLIAPSSKPQAQGSPSPDLAPGNPIKFTGGKYNGFSGVLMKRGDTIGSVAITYEGRQVEVIEHLHFMQYLDLPVQF